MPGRREEVKKQESIYHKGKQRRLPKIAMLRIVIQLDLDKFYCRSLCVTFYHEDTKNTKNFTAKVFVKECLGQIFPTRYFFTYRH